MTRATCVCWSMSSLTRTAHGSRPCRHGRSRRLSRDQASRVTSLRIGPDVVAIGPLALGRGAALPDHHLAAEVADLLAPLVEALGLDGHDAAVGLGAGLPLVQHPGLG